MAIFKCKMCGGALEISEDSTVAECEYCGTKQTVPTADSEKKMSLFTRANKLRAACDFDKAAGVYESIVTEFPEEAEAYWGLILCNYGIEYVDDPATGKKIPTCHRSSFDSVLDSSDFEMVMENADAVSRKVYRDEAKAIEELRKSIIEVSSKEEPYDIFICYKETDENGDRTIDSVIAQDVYTELTSKGYRVFFSRITLEDKLGQEYEPYIFAALNSAKIMLAFGTDYEYYNAVWVKNEWSRFLQLIAKGEKKTLIPCYKNIDAYDMPREFAKLQAQDMGKVGAIQDLLRGIEKITGGSQSAKSAEQVVVNQVVGGPNVEALLKRGNIAIEDGKFNDAKTHFDKVLDINAECAEAYLGMALVEETVCSVRDFVFRNRLNNKNYQRAKQYADKTLLDMLLILEKEAEEEREIARREEEKRQRKLEEEREIARREEEKRQRKLEEEKKELTKKLKTTRKKIRMGKQFIVTSAGGSFTCGIKSDGTVITVGEKENDQRITDTWTDIVAVSVGYSHIVGLKSNGTVVAAGQNDYGQCNVSDWVDITYIVTGPNHTVGLKSDGTVVAVGSNSSGQCKVSEWKDIVAISASDYHTVALKSDGTVVTKGPSCGETSTGKFKDIIAVSTGEHHTVGLKSNGTVIAVGRDTFGESKTNNWKDIVAISANGFQTVGLKTDGTVLAVGDNRYGQCNVSNWTDMVSVVAGYCHTVGLRSDGTVIAVGNNNYGQCNTSKWTNIAAIFVGYFHTVGLKSDGTVVAVGDNREGQCNVGDWKLFDNLDNLEQERKKKMAERRLAIEKLLAEEKRIVEEQKANYKSQNLCQHCGGTFKGLFTKKCTNCGKEKDY